MELRGNNGKSLLLRRFTPAGRGDVIISGSGDYWIRLKGKQEEVRLTPAWGTSAYIEVAGGLEIAIKEIETKEELEGYQRLTEFHYRGAGGAGRRVPLVAIAHCWELPEVVGFIELSSTFLVNTARGKIFNTTFSDPDRGIGWARWDMNAAKKYGNSVVRISRCVVFPELRGIGLSKVLVDAAVQYAKERWHIGGLRPSFIEITAEMLRYWPFVQGSGFIYVGQTEGNRHRAVKDMRYLLGRQARTNGLPQGGGGILSAQRSYAMTLAKVMKAKGLSIEQIITLLQRSPDKLSDEEWVQLYRVYRKPKPTYMRGLTPAACALLERRKALVSQDNDVVKPKTIKSEPILKIQGFGLEVSSKPTSTARARRVQEAFGIVTSEFRSVLLKDWDLVVNDGDIILIGGPSGCCNNCYTLT